MQTFLIVFLIFFLPGGFIAMVASPASVAGVIAILTLGFSAIIFAAISIIGHLSDIADQKKRSGR